MSILLPSAFLSGSPGPGELIVVFLVILILFGPKRLPEIARAIGKTLAQLRRASHDFRDQIMRIDEPPVHDVRPEPDSLVDQAVEDEAHGHTPEESGPEGDGNADEDHRESA